MAFVHFLNPYIKSQNASFQELFCDIGETGDIVDAALDFKKDIASGELHVPYSFANHATLQFVALKQIMRLVYKHPILLPEACVSVRRNIFPGWG